MCFHEESFFQIFGDKDPHLGSANVIERNLSPLTLSQINSDLFMKIIFFQEPLFQMFISISFFSEINHSSNKKWSIVEIKKNSGAEKLNVVEKKANISAHSALFILHT